VDYLIGTDEDLDEQSATDKAFFREYQRMTPEMKAKFRQMAKLLDK
jgi:hypothetical protein